jgi:hypothetical protein
MPILQSGYDYQIPGQFINPQQPAAPVGLPPVQSGGNYQQAAEGNDLLANRGKLTEDYYNNYGALDSYSKEMARQGINVFQPDYTQPGGGQPFQIAQQIQASVLHAANALKGEFESQQTLAPYEAKGDIRRKQGVDPNSLMYSDAQNFYGTDEDPRIKEANLRNREATYTAADSRRVNAQTSQALAAIDQEVANGIISAEEGEYKKGALIANVNTTNPYAFRPTPYDQKTADREKNVKQRVELIKQLKNGVVTGDQGVLNILRRVQGVEDVEYVNTGDEVGIRVYTKDGSSFIDLRKGGANDLNALLSNIEGQYNIANEELIPYSTDVQLPESNAAQVLEPAKVAITAAATKGDAADPTFVKLRDLAKQGVLSTPQGELIADISVDTNWLGTPKLKLTTYKVVQGKPTSKTTTRTVDLEDEPTYVDELFDLNKNSIGKAFGAGFAQPTAADPSIKLPGESQGAYLLRMKRTKEQQASTPSSPSTPRSNVMVN